MEKRDLYDKNRALTGNTIYKGEPVPEGSYITVVLVYIQNSEGKFLIQKRSKIKNGLYATTGGHPKSGEDSIRGIITEVKEENLVRYHGGRSDKERVFFDDYYVKMDIENINNLTLQEEEVESVHWFSTDEVTESMKNGTFFSNHYEEFEILLNWLDKNEQGLSKN